jgi:hypothetical protein
LIQDVVAGVPQPTSDMKADEFKRPVTAATLETDVFACAERAYAVAHLFLQPFDDRRILGFCDGGNQALIGTDGLLAANVRAIAAYEPRGKVLKLIWEESAISEEVIGRFAQFDGFGSSERLGGMVDGEPFSIYVLSIPPVQVAAFRDAVTASIPAVAP